MKIIYHGIVCGMFTIAALSSSVGWSGSFQADNSQPVVQPFSSWRLTKFGWQDSTSWYVDSFVPEQNLELIHPLILASLILLLVVAAMIWASNEWEIARLFGNRTKD